MSTRPLSVDPLWPRSGDWPSLDDVYADEGIDLALLGIPTWRTSLSTTGAAATPAAVRAALRYYAAFLSPDRSAPGVPPRSLDDLRFVDAGDVIDPDGPEAAALWPPRRRRGRVAALRGWPGGQPNR